MRELTTAIFEKYCNNKAVLKPSIPSLLTLDNERISTVGDVSKVEELFQSIKELDLTKNLISDWKVVIILLEHMWNLECMNLTMNQLDESTLEDDLKCKFRLKTLVLNGTGVSWPAIAKIVQCLPFLEELHISLNAYKSIDLPPGFKHDGGKLRKLYMNNNEINDLGEISKLLPIFPFIQSLNVITSEISSLPAKVLCDDLNLCESKVQSCEENNLAITEVPVLDEFEEKEKRQHLISRLPLLVILNGSPVTESERDTAERAFIRYYMDQDEKPRMFYFLRKKHGLFNNLNIADVDLSTPEPASSDSISLLVKFDDKMDYLDVDQNQTTAEFKNILQNFTGLPPTATIVYFVQLSEGVVQRVNHLRTASRILSSYKMKKGDQFVIERRPPASK